MAPPPLVFTLHSSVQQSSLLVLQLEQQLAVVGSVVPRVLLCLWTGMCCYVSVHPGGQRPAGTPTLRWHLRQLLQSRVQAPL
jgi:hypothetical protein